MVTQTRDGPRAVTGDREERNSKTRGPETRCAAKSPCQAEEAARRSEAEMEPLEIIETDRVCKGRALERLLSMREPPRRLSGRALTEHVRVKVAQWWSAC